MKRGPRQHRPGACFKPAARPIQMEASRTHRYRFTLTMIDVNAALTMSGGLAG